MVRTKSRFGRRSTANTSARLANTSRGSNCVSGRQPRPTRLATPVANPIMSGRFRHSGAKPSARVPKARAANHSGAVSLTDQIAEYRSSGEARNPTLAAKPHQVLPVTRRAMPNSRRFAAVETSA